MQGDRLQLRVDAELDEDVVDVVADSGQAQVELLGDFLVLQPRGQLWEWRTLRLARRQRKSAGVAHRAVEPT